MAKKVRKQIYIEERQERKLRRIAESRGISQAEENQASAVIIELSTPGGLLSTTEEIVDRILEAQVPVVVYVNRWAGSAGTFITLASHVAAMAPASRIGAASPVSIDDSEDSLSDTMKRKLTEDTAARIRSLADLRGRNLKAMTVARIAIGVAELPSGVPVEVEFLFEVS